MSSEKQNSIKIALISRKGGVGKSALAREFAFFMRDKYDDCVPITLYDCDPRGAQEEVVIAPPFDIVSVEPSDNIPLNNEGISVYDFASEPDKRLKKVIQEVDLVVIPFQPAIDSIIRTIDTFSFVVPHNDQILMICNMYIHINDVETSKSELEGLLGDKGIQTELWVLPIKQYTGIRSVENEGGSVLARFKKGGIYSRSFRPICSEIDKIVSESIAVIEDSRRVQSEKKEVLNVN
jgi:hypothetical protein